MRIDPPADRTQQPATPSLIRPVEEMVPVVPDPEKGDIAQVGDEASRRGPSFGEILERNLGGGDSSAGLADPDRDAWTQQVIGSRIHWQYGPDARRKPFFRHQTRRLDDPPSEGGDSRSDSGEPPSRGARGS